MENTENQNIIENDDIEKIEEIPLNRNSVKNIVFEIAVDMFALKDEDMANFEDMELEYDAKCDTLDIVEFIMSLEDEFGIIIRDDESYNLMTFGDYIDLVWNKVMADNEMIIEQEE